MPTFPEFSPFLALVLAAAALVILQLRSGGKAGSSSSIAAGRPQDPSKGSRLSRALNWADLWTVVRGFGAGERTWAAEVALDGIGEGLCGVSACQASVGIGVSRANRTRLYAAATR